MKNLKLGILLLTLGMTVSCAKESKVANTVPAVVIPPGTPYIPPGVGPGGSPGTGSTTEWGGSATITLAGASMSEQLATFGDYTCPPLALRFNLCHRPNNPQNLKLTLNMVKYGQGFGGTARISYTDNNIPHEAFFSAGDSEASAKYNVAFSYGGQTVWHGVFDDFAFGGFVVVIDEIIDLGDGAGPQDTVGGTIWFKNFSGDATFYHPQTYCWFVSLGPYDCRPWPEGKGMNTYQSKDPGAGYVKLGSFSGLSLKAAFNNEKLF